MKGITKLRAEIPSDVFTVCIPIEFRCVSFTFNFLVVSRSHPPPVLHSFRSK